MFSSIKVKQGEKYIFLHDLLLCIGASTCFIPSAWRIQRAFYKASKNTLTMMCGKKRISKVNVIIDQRYN